VKLRKLPIVVLVLTAAAIGLVTVLDQRADASREAQLRGDAVTLALTDLQSVPFNANPVAADERAITRGLSDAGALHKSRRNPATARAELATMESTIADILSIARSRGGSAGNSQAPALQRRLAASTSRLLAFSRDIGQADGDQAERAWISAAVWGGIAMLGLMLVFLLFYFRSQGARDTAEALAAENEQLLQASRVEASTDALTGLGNRRALIETLQSTLSAHEDHEALLAMFDLNGFKQYNDTFGHGAGDALLARLGSALSQTVIELGVAFRVGGDEFCVLARCTPSEGERLLAGSAAALSDEGDGWSIDCSYGAVWVPSEASIETDALRLADQRMYANKAGRSSASQQLTDVLLQVLSEQDKAQDVHVQHVAELAEEVASTLGLPAHEVRRIGLAAKLHDIGKTAIPSAILDKPGPLSGDEWEFIYRHTLIGERIVLAAPALAAAASLIRSSHERVDGGGYPDRLSGDQIPLGARILAVCNAFDAMTSDRPYRSAMTTGEARSELERCAGTQFDRQVVEAFCREFTPPGTVVEAPAAPDGTDFANGQALERLDAAQIVGVDVSEAIKDSARLAALHELGLLDTDPEAEFDIFTRLASQLLDVPVSLVSLIDADRQFIKSQHGLSGAMALARQTPLSYSVCQYAVATRQPLVISDARHEPAISDSLAVRELGVVAYAGMPLMLDDGHAVGALCAVDRKPRIWSEAELRILKDLSEAVGNQIRLREDLMQRGLYDDLTGLPNRSLLVAYCDRFLSVETSGRLAVMCAGLNDFSRVNQAFGAEYADKVLQAVGERLAGCTRNSDILGRLRGDIFTLLACGVKSESEAVAIASRLREQLRSEPLEIDGQRVSVSVTVGVAVGESDSRGGGDLISEAAHAMRQAKRSGAHVQVSESGWTALATAQLRLQEALAGALSNEEISAVFQPIAHLESGAVQGFETLARWHHPELGAVSPADFIPVAEATGEIIQIGRFMLEQACGQLARWRAAHGEHLQITVNVAPAQLDQPDFADQTVEILTNAGLEGESLVLEITEGVLLEGNRIQARNLSRLHGHGIRLALDDFGTGYSALSYLQRFPIDIIKIDRSFIDGVESDESDAALVQTILAMAETMGKRVVAEGIETVGQERLLQQLGCRYGQGFLFSRPLPADDVDGLEGLSLRAGSLSSASAGSQNGLPAGPKLGS
jgi:diguanylate cyclase (GGDEF)-like protein